MALFLTGRSCTGCPPYLAVVSDVAWGGQILMCSTSFEAIKYQTEDLDVASKGEVHGRPSQGWWRWWKW